MGVRRIYAGKDWSTLVSEVKSKLVRAFPEVNFEFENDLTLFIIQLVAYALENTHFFQDLQANEVFANTAQVRGFLAKIAAFHAYNPAGAAPASGEVGVSLLEAQVRTVTLEVGQGFAAKNGLTYEVVQQVVWAAGDTSVKQVSVSQIQSKTQTFRSNGGRLQRFNLDIESGKYLSYRSLEVRVDGEEWTESDAFLDTDTLVYRVAYTPSIPFLEFGDGAVGTIPPDGAEIFVQFKQTAGAAGHLAAGNITDVTPSVVVGGVTVSVVIDPLTGAMSGGAAPESSAVVRSKIPKAEHADDAIVVPDDFTGLVSAFRDPLFGAIAAATAVVATSIDNDLEAALLIASIKALFFDADASLTATTASVQAVHATISADADDIDALVALISAITSAAGTLSTDTATIVSNKDLISTQVITAYDETVSSDTYAVSAATATTSAQTESASIRSDVVGIATGGSDTLTTATKNALIARLDDLDIYLTDIDSRVTAGGSIPTSNVAIRSALSDMKTRLATIETTADSIDTKSAEAETSVQAILVETAAIQTGLTSADTELSTLQTSLTDPWDAAVLKVDELYTHLDSVFADPACGPNVVSVPILTQDADGFFAAPSVGLRRNVEAYIAARKEPSVVFRVIDGSPLIVVPTIDITFEPEAGEVPTRIRAEMEANTFGLIRGFDFGSPLNLDDLYDINRDVSGTLSVNIVVTGFTTGNPSTIALIDADGNLTIGGLEVISQPVLTFYEKKPDGSKELV